jgi:hypothetical protein
MKKAKPQDFKSLLIEGIKQIKQDVKAEAKGVAYVCDQLIKLIKSHK